MKKLSEVEHESRRLQDEIGALEETLREIDQNIKSTRDQSREMVSDILRSLNGIVESLPEHKQALVKVGAEIDRMRLTIGGLAGRGSAVGIPDIVAKQKEKILNLDHQWRDLGSDAEAVEQFHLNFKARLDRLS